MKKVTSPAHTKASRKLELQQKITWLENHMATWEGKGRMEQNRMNKAYVQWCADNGFKVISRYVQLANLKIQLECISFDAAIPEGTETFLALKLDGFFYKTDRGNFIFLNNSFLTFGEHPAAQYFFELHGNGQWTAKAGEFGNKERIPEMQAKMIKILKSIK